MITQDNVILKGYPQWQLARIQGLESMSCIEHALSEEDALHRLLQSHRRCNGLNDFARIVLALDLEPYLQGKARCNQRTGGTNKGSSTLTKAARVDVRSAIAAAAGVSTGNVTKVKQLLQLAHPELLQALSLGHLSIHRAWQWSEEAPEQQRRRLFQHCTERGVRKTIRQLVSRHRAEETRPLLALPELLRWLCEVDPTTDARDIQIAVVEAPGLSIFVSQELFHAIDSQQELRLLCAINNR